MLAFRMRNHVRKNNNRQSALGALIRYTDGNPNPARFTKKLAAWGKVNGGGRLVKKEPPRPFPTLDGSSGTLRCIEKRNFSSDGSHLITIAQAIRLTVVVFEVAEHPKLDKCVFFWTSGGNTEGRCIWRNPLPRPSSGSRKLSQCETETVSSEDGDRAGEAGIAA